MSCSQRVPDPDVTRQLEVRAAGHQNVRAVSDVCGEQAGDTGQPTRTPILIEAVDYQEQVPASGRSAVDGPIPQGSELRQIRDRRVSIEQVRQLRHHCG